MILQNTISKILLGLSLFLTTTPSLLCQKAEEGEQLKATTHTRKKKMDQMGAKNKGWNVPLKPIGMATLAFAVGGFLYYQFSKNKELEWVPTNTPISSKESYNKSIHSASFHPFNNSLIVCGGYKLILCDLKKNTVSTFEKGRHTQRVQSVAFSPDGRLIASGSSDKTVKIWDIERENCLHTLKGDDVCVNSVAFHPSGTRIVSGGNKTVKMWVKNGNAWEPDKKWDSTYALKKHTSTITSVAFSLNGQLLASGSRDKSVKIWDVKTGKLLQELKGHKAAIACVVFSPDSTRIATSSRNEEVKLWDTKTGGLLGGFTYCTEKNKVLSIDFNPDGTRIVTANRNGEVKVWDVEHPKQVTCLDTLKSTDANISSVAFDTTGTRILVGNKDGEVTLWNLEPKKKRKQS